MQENIKIRQDKRHALAVQQAAFKIKLHKHHAMNATLELFLQLVQKRVRHVRSAHTLTKLAQLRV